MSFVAQISAPTALAVETMLSAARLRAEAIGVRANIAIVDAGGNLSGFIRMPGSFLSSIELSIDKAYTAASFSITTRNFSDLLENSPRQVRDGLLRRARLTEVPGGLPIELAGSLAGGIGVSGGSDEQDEDIASHAVAGLAVEMTQGKE